MKKLDKVLGKVAKKIKQQESCLYELTYEDVVNIEVALRLRIEALEENDEYKMSATYKRTRRKFTW